MYSVEYCQCPCHKCWSVVKNDTDESSSESVNSAPSSSSNPNKKKSEDENIIQSGSDTKEYRAFTLSNKLKVLVIRDLEAKIGAGACLSVLVGSMQDPEQIPGLAHFCERMVILGTEKYPEENCLGKFLAENSGNYNAHTHRNMTNFYFDVGSSSLEEALDRFAQLFIAPLFLEEFAEREVQAINSEYKSKISTDSNNERRDLVDMRLSRPGHPYSKFDCGNYNTLWIRPNEESLDVVEEAKTFFNELYSANLMNLVVLGCEKCDELQEMITRIFSPIKNKDLEIPSWPESPYGPDELATRIDLVPITDSSSVVLIFPVPDQTEHYKIGATQYIVFLLNHAYLHGLSSFVKQKHWSVHGVQASYKRPGKGFAFLAVEMDLSNEGLDRVDDVILCVFQYLQFIRTSGPQKRIWDEIKLVNDIEFYYAEKEYSESVMDSLATAMWNVPVRDILVSTYSVIDDYQSEEISKLLDFLIPTNMRLIVTAQSNEGIANIVDEWCGAKYKYSKIDNALIHKWEMCGLDPAFQLPEPDSLLPRTFELKARDSKGGKFPRLIEENFRSEVWFLQDNQYKLPQAHLHISSPQITESVSSFNLLMLFVECFRDSMSEYRANVRRSGLRFDLSARVDSLYLTAKGYDCKCGDLFEYLVKSLLHYRSVNERFEDLCQNIIRKHEEMVDIRPGASSHWYFLELLITHYWSDETRLRDMNNKKYTAHDMAEFIRKVFSKVQLKWLFVGNLTEEEALRTYCKCSACFDEIGAKPMTCSERHSVRQVWRQIILPAGTITIYPRVQNTYRESATLLALQCCAGGIRESTLLDVLYNTILEPKHNVLDIEEQLGDVGYAEPYPWSYLGANALYFVIEGEKEPSYLDERIENFLADFCQSMDRMDEDVFRDNVLEARRKLQILATFTEQGEMFFDEIQNETYIFDRTERTLMHLQSITLKELQEYFHEWISPYSARRKKLSLQIKSQVEDPDLIDQHSHRTPTTPSTSTSQAKPGTKSLSQEETSDIKKASSTEKPNILQARFSNDRSSMGKRFSNRKNSTDLKIRLKKD